MAGATTATPDPAVPAGAPSEARGSDMLEAALAAWLVCGVLLVRADDCRVLVEDGVAMGLALEKVEFVGAAVPVRVLLVVVECDVVVILAETPRCPVRVKGTFVDVADDGLMGPAVLALLLVAVDSGPRFAAEVGFALFADKVLVFLV